MKVVAKILIIFFSLSFTCFAQTPTLVKDIYPLIGTSSIGEIISLDDKVFFGADNSTHGTELWVSDGSEAGTYMLKDIYPGSRLNSSQPRTFRKYGNILIFNARDAGGSGLFRTDGTEPGTFKIWNQTREQTYSEDDIVIDGVNYWLVNYTSLIIKDLNSMGSQVILDKSLNSEIVRLGGANIANSITKLGNKWLFNAYLGSNLSGDKYGIFVSDGTKTGTKKILDTKRALGLIKADTPDGPRAFFYFDDNIYGNELWVTDGTEAGTRMVKNIAPGGISSNSVGLVFQARPFGMGIIFTTNVNGDYSYWTSEGTEGSTLPYTKIAEGTPKVSIKFLRLNNDKEQPFFIYSPIMENRTELWRITEQGAILVSKNTNIGDYSNFNSNYKEIDGFLYFTNSENESLNIFKVNLNTSLLTMVAFIKNYRMDQYAIAGTQLFYRGYIDKSNYDDSELWKMSLCSHTAKVNTPNGISFCPGGSVSISGEGSGESSPFSFNWKQGNKDMGTAANLTVTQAGNYSLEVTDKNGCTVSAAVSITQTANLPVTISGTNSVCIGQSTTLTATASGGVAPYTYQWKQAERNVGANASTFNASDAGNFAVVVTDSKGCAGTSAGFVITQKPSPNVTITKNGSTDFIAGGAVVLSVPTAPNQNYQWLKDGVAIAGATNNSYTATGAGTFAVTVTGNGCSATSEKVNVNLILANESFEVSDLIKVYPNPAENQIRVHIQEPLKKTARLSLINASGLNVKEWNVNQQEDTLDLRNLPIGIYLLRSNINDKEIIQKIVKQN